MLKKVIAVLAMATSLTAMHQIEINLNNYDLDARLDFDMGQFNASVDPDSVFIGARYLHGSHQHSDSDLHKDHDLFDGHFFVRQRLRNANALTLGMGVKFVYTSIQSNDFYALPLGLLAGYDLPLGLPVPFTVGGEFYYSPQVLSFGEAKTIWNTTCIWISCSSTEPASPAAIGKSIRISTFQTEICVLTRHGLSG